MFPDVWWESFVCLSLCLDSVGGLFNDEMATIDLFDYCHVSPVSDGEVGMYMKLSRKGESIVVSNRNKTLDVYSLFDDCFLWTLDWSSAQKENFS